MRYILEHLLLSILPSLFFHYFPWTPFIFTFKKNIELFPKHFKENWVITIVNLETCLSKKRDQGTPPRRPRRWCSCGARSTTSSKSSGSSSRHTLAADRRLLSALLCLLILEFLLRFFLVFNELNKWEGREPVRYFWNSRFPDIHIWLDFIWFFCPTTLLFPFQCS